MKKYFTDTELLSAYLDNELTVQERNDLEQRISYSPDLQKKLKELQKLKYLTTSSIQRLPEDPYFETRLRAELNSGRPAKKKLLKWSPVFGIAALTIFIMLLLKYNPSIIDAFVEDQKTTIASFYEENLRPLLFAADMSNEDIFNFAFYHQLPLDSKDNQYLQIGYDSMGKEFFEIRPAGTQPSEVNMDNFIKLLNLNENEKQEMDSILGAYAEELQSQILVNEKNTVAINPNLWNYNKAIAADLVRFALSKNKDVIKKVVPVSYSMYDSPKIDQMVKQVKKIKENEYIFLTPDTIYNAHFVYNKDKYKEEMKRAREEWNRAGEDLNRSMRDIEKELQQVEVRVQLDKELNKLRNKSSRHNNFVIQFDSNMFRVQFENIEIPKIELPDFEEMSVHIENATKNLKTFVVSTPPPAPGYKKPKNMNYNFKYNNNDSSYNYNMVVPEVQIPKLYGVDLDSLINTSVRKHRILNDDSIETYEFGRDSIYIFNNKEYIEQMKEFEKQMDELRIEMNNLKKDANKEKKELNRDTIRKKIEVRGEKR